MNGCKLFELTLACVTNRVVSLMANVTYMGSRVSDSHVFKVSMFSMIILDSAELSLHHDQS